MIDGWTISLASALVVVVTAALFIGSTISHKDSEAGRIWAAGYLCGILTTMSFLVWLLAPELWWASSVGNTAFVAGTGFFWIGCRRHNGRPTRFLLLAIVCTAVLVAGLLPGPDSDEWAGAHVYFLGNMLFAVLAAVESARGELSRALGSRPMVVVFSVEAVFFTGRLILFTTEGPDGPIFSLFFGASATAFVTMIMVIVLSSSMSVIRSAHGAHAELATRSSRRTAAAIGYNSDDVLTEPSFERVLADWLERAEFHDEQLALLHFDLDDLAEINTAFGRARANTILARYTAVVRRFGPPNSDIGVAGPGRLVLATPMSSVDEALAVAATVQAGLLEEKIDEFAGLRPTMSVGIALTDYTGFDFELLSAAAMRACKRASDAGGNRIMLDTGLHTAGPLGSGVR
ncbi:GGDEF domain-containing protein [Microterricola gilva]|uniref:GGDEF domain-containing protein n=1 Tax=Microterricola gilva TaxID=393267 RepID=A0A4Q8AQ38_9MICO|nr:diguanylate cyclase [Microterricola gilva]RZU66311.1 GGDEF domain-containing protein [Microterricola gilva]